MATNDWTNGGGTNIWSDGANWSLTHKPAAGEDVTFSSSTAACSVDEAVAAINSLTITVAVTITVNAAQTQSFNTTAITNGTLDTNGQTVTFAAITLNASSTLTYGASSVTLTGTFMHTNGTYNPGSATISTNSNYNNSGGTFNIGTEVVTATATATFTGNNVYDTAVKCYSLVISTGITLTSSAFTTTLATMNGTAKLTGVMGVVGTGTPLTLSGSEQYTANAGWSFNSVTCNLTASTRYDTIYLEKSTVLTLLNTTTIITLNVGAYLGGAVGTSTAQLDTGGNTLNTTTLNVGAAIANRRGFITCGASTITATTVNIATADTANSYLTMNTSQWSVAGNWTTASTSASYNVGTSTVTFTANATFTNNGSGGSIFVHLYNVVINAGVTLQVAGTSIGISGVITMANTSTLTLNVSIYASNIAPLSLTGTPTINGTGPFMLTAINNTTIPAATFNCDYLHIYLQAANKTVTMTGDITTKGLLVASSLTGVILATDGYNITQTSTTSSYKFAIGHYGNISSINCTGSGGRTTSISAKQVDFNDAGAFATMSNSLWSVSGNWTSVSTSASYNVGTSTVTFTASANVSLGASFTYTTGDFYNLIVNPTFTLTLTSATMGIAGTLTTNGSLGGLNTRIVVLLGSGTCWVRGGADTVSLSADFRGNSTIPGGTYAGGMIITGNTGTLGGNIIVTGTFDGTIAFYTQSNGKFDTSVNSYNVTTPSNKRFYLGGVTCFITCHASIFTIGEFFNTNAASYIVFNTSQWSVAGNWTCASTSASWSAGTSTVNFNGGGAQTLGLNNGNSANIQYYNITISNSSAATVTLGANNIRVNGLLNISSATCTVSETVNNPTWTIYGGITKANGSTWTRGTGLMTLAGSQVLTDNGVVKTDLKNVTENGVGITVVMPAGAGFNFSGTLRIQSGTFITGDLTAITTLVNNGTWTRVGGGASTVTIGTLQIDLGATFISADATTGGGKKIGIPGLVKLSEKHIGGEGY